MIVRNSSKLVFGVNSSLNQKPFGKKEVVVEEDQLPCFNFALSIQANQIWRI